MKALADAMNDAMNGMGSKPESLADEFAGHPEAARLQEMAGEWAKMSVLTFTGDLLTKSLAVSRAIAEFTQELTSGSAGKRTLTMSQYRPFAGTGKRCETGQRPLTFAIPRGKCATTEGL